MFQETLILSFSFPEASTDRGRARRSAMQGWTRESHRQSDEHWNCFKGNAVESFVRRGGAHMVFFLWVHCPGPAGVKGND